MIQFTVPLEPVAKGRPRVYNRRAVTPEKTRLFEGRFRTMAAQYEPESPIEYPVKVALVFYQKRPKRLRRQKDPEGRVICPMKPDIDNLIKSVLDAMERWWRDDKQVVSITAVKYYAEKTGKPRIEVCVSEFQ